MPMQAGAKMLGALNQPNFCSRCFWLRVHQKNRLPFGLFTASWRVPTDATEAV